MAAGSSFHTIPLASTFHLCADAREFASNIIKNYLCGKKLPPELDASEGVSARMYFSRKISTHPVQSDSPCALWRIILGSLSRYQHAPCCVGSRPGAAPMRASRVGKWRYSVPGSAPVRFAMSSRGASVPRGEELARNRDDAIVVASRVGAYEPPFLTRDNLSITNGWYLRLLWCSPP